MEQSTNSCSLHHHSIKYPGATFIYQTLSRIKQHSSQVFCVMFLNGVRNLSASIANKASTYQIHLGRRLLLHCMWRDTTPNTQGIVFHPVLYLPLQGLVQLYHQNRGAAKVLPGEHGAGWNSASGWTPASGHGGKSRARLWSAEHLALSLALMRLTGCRSATITAAYKSNQWRDCAWRLQTTTMRPSQAVYPSFYLEITDIPLRVASCMYIMR